jgi:hypothetical protein
MAVNKVPLHFDLAHFTREGSEYYSAFLFNAIKHELIGRRMKVVEATAGPH